LEKGGVSNKLQESKRVEQHLSKELRPKKGGGKYVGAKYPGSISMGGIFLEGGVKRTARTYRGAKDGHQKGAPRKEKKKGFALGLTCALHKGRTRKKEG